MSDVRSLFATPFIIESLRSAQGLQELRESILARAKSDPTGLQVSNVGGWHSTTDMIDWGGEAAGALAYKAMTLADEHTIDVKGSDAKRFEWIPEMWANISSAGDANQYHTHPGSFWSVVAYIDDGYQGSSDAGLGGQLQLLDPRMPMVRMTAPDLRFADSGKPQANEIAIRPRTGMLVMFPSWLQHAVQPFRGSGQRISVAINLVPAMLPPA